MPAVDVSLSAKYKRDGFVVVEHLITREAIESLRKRIVEIADGRVPSFPSECVEHEPNVEDSRRSVRKINQCAENDAVFMAQARSDSILDVVETLIGPDIKLYGSQCFMKPPGGVEKPYHQDSAYFPIEPRALVTCWIALDDVTLENGCLWVIPGSHRGELHNHSQPWQVGERVDKQVPDDKIDRARETPITLSAGGCSFHHSMLLHRSGPNQSQDHRRGLAFHYVASRSRWTHPTQVKPSCPLLRGREHEGCV